MKIKQTYKTAAICAVFLTVWMISGSLVEEENFAKSDSSLDTLSSTASQTTRRIPKPGLFTVRWVMT